MSATAIPILQGLACAQIHTIMPRPPHLTCAAKNPALIAQENLAKCCVKPGRWQRQEKQSESQYLSVLPETRYSET